MKNLLSDFKGFALSGNVIDLAIGVIVAIAFGDVVQSFSDNVLMAAIGAVFGEPNFDNLVLTVGRGQIAYGAFITTLVNFVIIAFSLLLVVKLLQRIGMNFRAQGNRECDYCKELVPVDASRCKFCTSELVPEIAD